MAETQQAKFEGWAIVELMGHQKEIGYVTTEVYGAAVMFRIDQPELPAAEYETKRPEWFTMFVAGQNTSKTWPTGTKVQRAMVPAKSRLVSPGALYAINPCTEEFARESIAENCHRPLILLELPALPAGAPDYVDAEEPDDDGDPDRE